MERYFGMHSGRGYCIAFPEAEKWRKIFRHKESLKNKQLKALNQVCVILEMVFHVN